MRSTIALLWSAICLVVAATEVRADTFVYIDKDGAEQTVNTQLLGTGQDAMALLQADGQIRVIPEGAVTKRETADGPAPITPAGMVDVLKQRFGADVLRTQTDKQFVIALVASGPIDRRTETRVKGFLQKTTRFMNNVNTVFERFARDMNFPLHDPEYPLVTVVFESDEDFNTFTTENTEREGISATHIAGFYSPLTNWLAIRLEECRTFRVPLHEAIHQQMYNRVFQRLAPIPRWFDEGIATGFENNGEKVDIHPAKINSQYAWLSKHMESDDVKWADIVNDDESFGGDILAAESYVEAWALHWMLVTQHEAAYRKYVQELASRTPLEDLPAEQRTERFKAIFGESVATIAEQFPRVLDVGIKRQKVKAPPQSPDGVMVANEALAEIKVKALNDLSSGRLLVEGQIKNTSPIRAMTYHVAVVTSSGTYTDWVIESLDVNASAPLPGKAAAKVLPGTIGGLAATFTVRVQAALPGSATANEWVREAPLPKEFQK